MEYIFVKRDFEYRILRQKYLERPDLPLKFFKIERQKSSLKDFNDHIKFLSDPTCTIEHLEVFHLTMSDRKAELLSQCIRQSQLTHLTIDKCKLRISHIETICDSIRHQKLVTMLTFRNVNILRTAGEHLKTMM